MLKATYSRQTLHVGEATNRIDCHWRSMSLLYDDQRGEYQTTGTADSRLGFKLPLALFP